MFDAVVAFLKWGRDHVVGAILLALLAVLGLILYEILTVIVPALTSEYLADRVQFKSAITSYAVLNDSLNGLRMRYGAGRVGLFRFHNGSRDVQGVAFYFVSAATMVGVSVDMKTVTDLNASIYSPAYADLTKNKPWCVFAKDLLDGPLRDLTKSRGDVYLCLFPIFDLAKNFSGFMQVTWLDTASIPPEKTRFQMESDLQAETDKMSGYFLWTDGGKK